MAYTKYSLTPANNNAAPPDGAPEGMLPSAVNDTMRDMMAQIRDCGDGIRGGTYTMTAPVITGGSVTGITDLAVADGGTGASTAANARTNLGAAASGANSDITSLTGLTTPLSVAQGGTGSTTGSSTQTGFKNRIINGDMRINQRSASGTIGSGVYQVDRFKCFLDTSPLTLTFTQSTTAPAGFINSSLLTVTSAGTLGTGQGNTFLQSIEGLNVVDLGFGTANAKTITVSAWVRSSVTGTFGGSLTNFDNTRAYPFSYSIPVANTFTQISVTIPGDTSGTWKTDTSAGMSLWFSIGTGATLSGTAGSWAGANYISATGATSLVGTNGATFYITGIQLEVGSSATSFEFRDYGRELMLCQRYYESYNYPQVAVAAGIPNALQYVFSFATTKRTAPTMTLPASTNQGLNKLTGGTLTPGFAWSASGTINSFQIYAGDSNIGGFVTGTATASSEL